MANENEWRILGPLIAAMVGLYGLFIKHVIGHLGQEPILDNKKEIQRLKEVVQYKASRSSSAWTRITLRHAESSIGYGTKYQMADPQSIQENLHTINRQILTMQVTLSELQETIESLTDQVGWDIRNKDHENKNLSGH